MFSNKTDSFTEVQSAQILDLESHYGANSPEVEAYIASLKTEETSTLEEVSVEEEHEEATTKPESISNYGEEQWNRCRDALSGELGYLFDGDGRDRLAVRCGYPMNPTMCAVSGVYDKNHARQLLEDLANVNIAGYVVWATLNTFDESVPTTNTLHRGCSLGKKHITRLRWLLVDLDPQRPKDVEATEEERSRASAKMEDITQWLMTVWGFPEPIVVMSGNGYQLKFRLDLPADKIAEKILKSVLSILDAHYSDEQVNIDTAVWDLPRICKVPGTYSRKGVPTEERPQRLAYTISRPTTLEVIDAERLQQIVAAHTPLLEEVAAAETKRYEREHKEYETQGSGTGYLTVEDAHAKVQDWCARNSILYTTDHADGVAYYRLDRCLYLEASEDAHAQGVTTHNKGNKGFICVWEHENAEGKPGKIGAGCKTEWCQKVYTLSGVPAWECLKRLADPDYAKRAVEWETKRAQCTHDTATQQTWEALGADALKNPQERVLNEAEYFNPDHKTENPLDDLTFTERFATVSFDDASNALRVAEHYGQYVRYVRPSKGLILWKGDVWRPDSAKVVRAFALEITVKELTTIEAKLKSVEKGSEAEDALKAIRSQIIASRGKNRLDACIDILSSLPHLITNEEEVDNKPLYFNVPHNTLHLDDREFRAYRPNPADLLTKQSLVVYAPQATCPVWEEFIALVMKQNPEKMTYLQRWCGYALTGDIGEKAFCVLLGEPDTGKTTFINVLMAVMGEYGKTARIQTFLSKHAEALTNDVARLASARVVSTSEANEYQVFSEEFVKLITGGGRVTARFLHKEDFEFVPQFKLFFDTNVMPRINTEDQALWNRMKVIRFDQKFVRHAIPGMDDALPMDERLKYTLHAELSGILNWFLRGYDLWREQGLNTPEIIEQETRQQQEASDKYTPFLKEYCFPVGRCKTEDLYKVYRHWCKSAENVQERFIPTREKFTEAIRKRGYVKKPDGKNQCFYNLCIKPSILSQLGMTWYGLKQDEVRAQTMEETTPPSEG